MMNVIPTYPVFKGPWWTRSFCQFCVCAIPVATMQTSVGCGTFIIVLFVFFVFVFFKQFISSPFFLQ